MAFKLSDQIADTLLDKLSSDDEFRALFQKNARKALASLGFEPAAKAGPDEKGLWACCAVEQLASKEAIAKSRKELREQFTSGAAIYNPISLKA